jgi:hypothetical protein
MVAHAKARARYRTLDRRNVKGQGGRGGHAVPRRYSNWYIAQSLTQKVVASHQIA